VRSALAPWPPGLDRTHASDDRFKRSKLHKKFLCEVVAHLAKKYERLETEVRPAAQVPVLTGAE
jgi:hypothetical protein